MLVKTGAGDVQVAEAPLFVRFAVNEIVRDFFGVEVFDLLRRVGCFLLEIGRFQLFDLGSGSFLQLQILQPPFGEKMDLFSFISAALAL